MPNVQPARHAVRRTIIPVPLGCCADIWRACGVFSVSCTHLAMLWTERLEAASERALLLGSPTRRRVLSLLQQGLAKTELLILDDFGLKP